MACDKCFMKAVVNTYTSSMIPSTENLWIFSLFVLIFGSTWVRGVNEWIPQSWKNTCSDVHLFPLPFGSCCTPQKMKAIITVIVPRFWQPSLHSLFPPQTICNLLPAANGFSVWLLFLSLSLLLPPWMCVMSMWDFEGDSVWLLMWCAIATLNLWWRICQACACINFCLIPTFLTSFPDLAWMFASVSAPSGRAGPRTGREIREHPLPGKMIPLTICLST